MINNLEKAKVRKIRRKLRVRRKILGTSEMPRLTVYRSNRYIYAQLIDDTKGFTLCSASSLKLNKKLTCETAKEVGETIGKFAVEKGIKSIVFDRNGYKYHGRVKALADGARSAGLQF